MGFPDLTIQLIAIRVLALLIIVGLHGGILAGAAVLLGDKGPKYDGRLTVVPNGHVDLLGAAGTVISGIGWGKPVAVDAGQLRIGRIGIFAVVLAGFVGLLVLAALLDALVAVSLTTLPYSAGLTTAAFLRVASGMAIWFALLSLVPIPPLAGGLLLGAFGIRVPRQAERIIAIALLVAVATGLVRQALGPAYGVVAPLVLGE